jgi:hypothetical protein
MRALTSAGSEHNNLVIPFVQVTVVNADIAESGLSHQIGYFLGREQTEVMLSHGILPHLFPGPEGNGCESPVPENSPYFAQPSQRVGPEIDRIDGEDTIENGIFAGEMRNIAKLHLHPAFRDLKAQSALGPANHVRRNVYPRHNSAVYQFGEECQGSAAAKSYLQDPMLGVQLQKRKSGIDDLAIDAIHPATKHQRPKPALRLAKLRRHELLDTHATLELTAACGICIDNPEQGWTSVE